MEVSASELSIFVRVSPLLPDRAFCDDYVIHRDFTCHVKNFDVSIHSIPDEMGYFKRYFETHKFKGTVFKDINYNYSFVSDMCQCIHSCLKSNRNMKSIKLHFDCLFFSCLMAELQRSRVLRSKFLLNIHRRYATKFRCGESASNYLCPECKTVVWGIRIYVFLKWPSEVLDVTWGRKIQQLVNEKSELENAMAWLSTLGGAFSALGDSFSYCAEKAHLISRQQLLIAIRLGDPNTISRCKIYIAMSLLQKGFYKKAKVIIREQYEFATKGFGRNDSRLKNMCIAAWNRLKYLLFLRRHHLYITTSTL